MTTAQLRALLDKATKGPMGFSESETTGRLCVVRCGKEFDDVDYPVVADHVSEEDADLVAEMWNALPQLLAIAEAAQRIDETLRGTMAGLSPAGLALTAALSKLTTP